MSISRIYQKVSLSVGARLRLDEKASHHLSRVLRAAVNDAITLFNGEGGEYSGSITHIDKKGVEVELKHFVAHDVEAPVDIYLAQGIARGEKMDFIVQKAVELGVTKIFPLITERGNVRLDQEREDKRMQHWQSVIISACEQSGRNRIPQIVKPLALPKFLTEMQADHRFVLSPHVTEQLAEQKIAIGTSIAILIGPEGGLSEQEVALALQNKYTPLRLGPRVLRTETATIAALSVLQSRFGDMG